MICDILGFLHDLLDVYSILIFLPIFGFSASFLICRANLELSWSSCGFPMPFCLLCSVLLGFRCYFGVPLTVLYNWLHWNKNVFIRVNLFSLELLSQAKNIPVVLQSFFIKMLGKSVKGFLSYYWTYKQRLLRYM